MDIILEVELRSNLSIRTDENIFFDIVFNDGTVYTSGFSHNKDPKSHKDIREAIELLNGDKIELEAYKDKNNQQWTTQNIFNASIPTKISTAINVVETNLEGYKDENNKLWTTQNEFNASVPTKISTAINVVETNLEGYKDENNKLWTTQSEFNASVPTKISTAISKIETNLEGYKGENNQLWTTQNAFNASVPTKISTATNEIETKLDGYKSENNQLWTTQNAFNASVPTKISTAVYEVERNLEGYKYTNNRQWTTQNAFNTSIPTKISTAIKEIEIERRNLLTDSNIPLTNNLNNKVGEYIFDTPLIIGEEYTITWNGRCGGADCSLSAYTDTDAIIPGSESIYTYDKTITSTFIYESNKYQDSITFKTLPATNYNSVVNWAVLVKGNSGVTAWTPSTSDFVYVQRELVYYSESNADSWRIQGEMNITFGNFINSNRTNISNKLNLSGGAVTGKIVVSDANRDGGMYGTYNNAKTQNIWSMGISYKIPADGTNFGTTSGLVFKPNNNITGGDMAHGDQIAYCTNGSPLASLGNYIWSKNGFIKNESSNDYLLLGGGGHIAKSSFLPMSGGTIRGAVNISDSYLTLINSKYDNAPATHARSVILITRSNKSIVGCLGMKGYKTAFEYFYLGTGAYNSTNNLRVDQYGITSANGFKKYESSDSYILLGGGGHVAKSAYLSTEGGALTGALSAPTYVTESDERLKENIIPISDETLSNVNLLNTVEYNLKSTGEKAIGYIAQDVELLYPNIVKTDNNGMKALDYNQLQNIQIAYLMKTISEMKITIEELKQTSIIQ